MSAHFMLHVMHTAHVHVCCMVLTVGGALLHERGAAEWALCTAGGRGRQKFLGFLALCNTAPHQRQAHNQLLNSQRLIEW